MCPGFSTIGDIWDEEENDIISKTKLQFLHLTTPKRKVNAFHKQITKLRPLITSLIRNAPKTLPLPLKMWVN